MNKFDEVFFSSYVTNETKLITVLHKHIIVIVDKIIINYFFGVIIPSFLYYYSDTIKSYIPFFIFEIFLIWMFIRGLYTIFDWYNDVWIITEDWVIDLDWKMFNSNSVTVKYAWIEGLEFIEKWFLDALLWKWDIVIHKVGGWNKFILENASNAFENIGIIDKKLKEIKKKHTVEKIEPVEQNFETILKALSWVVEWYLENSWYKKNTTEDKKAFIKEIKKKWWAIDLTVQKDNKKEEKHH